VEALQKSFDNHSFKMNTSVPKPAESGAAATAFSYAQAAKGRTTTSTSTTVLSSQNSSRSNTPSREAGLAVDNALDSVNGSITEIGRSISASGDRKQDIKTSTTLVEVQSLAVTAMSSSPSSPSYGSASTSTLPKEEEIPTASKLTSDSPWDRQPTEPSENRWEGSDRKKGGKRSRKDRNADKEAEKEKEEPKPVEILVAAPPPAVNIWQQRMGAQAAKAKPVIVEVTTVIATTVPTETTENKAAEKKKTKVLGAEDQERPVSAGPNGVRDAYSSYKGQKKGSEGARGKDEPFKRSAPRGGRLGDKDEKTTQALPPVDDAISWPTPETALEEEKRKAQEKVVKEAKQEEEESSAKQPRQKKEWVTVPYTPTVTFNTPLPSRGARGRGGARGVGRDGPGGRGGHASNGSVSGEKAGTTTASNASSEVRERGRDSASSGRATSLPPNNKRSAGDSYRDARKPSAAHNFEKKPEAAQNKGEPASNGPNRRSSVATQTDPTHAESRTHGGEKVEELNGVSHDGQAHAQSHTLEHRNDGNGRYNGDNNGHQGRERTERSERGGRGAYRGRGGNHNNYQNGQQHPQHTFANGHTPQPINTYNMRQSGNPYSPPPNQQYANGFPPTQTSRGRTGAPPRSQSIPNGHPMFARYPVSVPGGQPQMMPIQTTGPMFEYPAMQSMSAVPYNPYVDQYSVLAMVTMQLEYYFSIDNLCKDVFLRKHMDSQGFVFLSFIAGFKRIQALTQDFDLLRYACQESQEIEIVTGDDGIDRVRRHDGWEKWVMPIEDREEPARNSGPKSFMLHSHIRNQQIQQQRLIHQSPPVMPPTPFSPNGEFQQYGAAQSTNGVHSAYVHHHNSPLSAAVPDFAPAPVANGTSATDYLDAETTFTDEEVNRLNVVYTQRATGDAIARGPYHTQTSRTFSNGSIDGRLINQELEDLDGRTLVNGDDNASDV
jgi:la-related protein 1